MNYKVKFDNATSKIQRKIESKLQIKLNVKLRIKLKTKLKSKSNTKLSFLFPQKFVVIRYRQNSKSHDIHRYISVYSVTNQVSLGESTGQNSDWWIADRKQSDESRMASASTTNFQWQSSPTSVNERWGVKKKREG